MPYVLTTNPGAVPPPAAASPQHRALPEVKALPEVELEQGSAQSRRCAGAAARALAGGLAVQQALLEARRQPEPQEERLAAQRRSLAVGGLALERRARQQARPGQRGRAAAAGLGAQCSPNRESSSNSADGHGWKASGSPLKT